ncbi:CLUMA_CG001980, isoform A [Clunio marinus]|uniref:CLUMA_CG001980, isoform A n=1 Tax=Clunio marinus TaxID=568069 RepID=A0A1J1HJI8_9DIPT|nr:CLUMA_CG001980, isoform A [Clunio marinus]
MEVDFYGKPMRHHKFICLTTKIRELKKLYKILYDSSEFINGSVGVTILTIMLIVVALITASGYWLFIIIIRKESIDKVSGAMFAVFTSFLTLIIITFNCSNCEKYMKDLLDSIDKFECESFYDIDEVSFDMLLKFYKQLSIEPMKFTTAGLYNINLKLWSSELFPT